MPGVGQATLLTVQDVDLIGDSTGTGGVFGGLSQSFATIPGQEYQLTFDYSHNNGTQSPTGDYAVQVTAADANAPANTIFSVERSQPFFPQVGFPSGGWQTFSQNFIAISDLTLLTFIDTRGAFNAGICGSCFGGRRPHRRCWTPRPDLGERWPSRLVAQAAEHGLRQSVERGTSAYVN